MNVIFFRKMSQRSKVFIVDSTLSELTGSRLPTKVQILRHLLYFTQVLCLKIDDAVAKTLGSAAVFWEKAGYRMLDPKNAKRRILELYHTWSNLQRIPVARRDGPLFQMKCETFKAELEKGCDFAGEYVKSKLSKEEDLHFLEDQLQGDRKCTIGGIDKRATKKAADAKKRKLDEKRRAKKWKELKKHQNQIQVNN